MRVDEDSAKIGFPPPLIYLGILLLGLAYNGLTGHIGPAGAISIVTGGVFLLAGAAVILPGWSASDRPEPSRSRGSRRHAS